MYTIISTLAFTRTAFYLAEGRPVPHLIGASVLAPSAFSSVAFETVLNRRLRARPPGQRVARADFLKVGHFALFSQFLHITGRNFPRCFFR